MKIGLICFALFLLLSFCIAQTGRELKEITDPKYKSGQVWTYKTRPGEENSTFTVLLVQDAPKGKRIVHIRLDQIRLKNCRGGPEPDTAAHMPFDKEAIDASALKVIRTIEVPDFKDGYQEWVEGWNQSKAGFYTITIAQAVDVMEHTFNTGLGCAND